MNNKVREVTVMMIMTLTALAIGAVILWGCNVTSKYTKTCEVVETKDGIITLVDSTGYLWECEGFTEETELEVVFHDNGTIGRKDERVVNFK